MNPQKFSTRPLALPKNRTKQNKNPQRIPQRILKERRNDRRNLDGSNGHSQLHTHITHTRQ